MQSSAFSATPAGEMEPNRDGRQCWHRKELNGQRLRLSLFKGTLNVQIFIFCTFHMLKLMHIYSYQDAHQFLARSVQLIVCYMIGRFRVVK